MIEMMMNATFQPPMALVREAAETQEKSDCVRKQAVFELFPDGEWWVYYHCGTNEGLGSDNGYGVGHDCSKKCILRIPMKELRR